MQNKPTVFVLGAGFTHAFCSSAPLLRWDITNFKQGLMKKYKGFPKILSVLKSLESDEENRVNIEELLSRLYSGMPYDDIYLSEGDRKVLYEDVFNYLIEIIQKIEVDSIEKSTLELFARYVIE